MHRRCSGGRVGRRVSGKTGDTPVSTFGFTIVEILVVMVIILVLAGLVLATSSYVQKKGAHSRAEAEIAAISAALENYKADNGIYPPAPTLDPRTQGDPSQQIYNDSSLLLYTAVSGDSNLDRQPELTSYISFKPNQLGPNDQASLVTFLKDPFGYSYGYSTAGQTGGTAGYNPTFDLWSTGGVASTSNPPNQAQWIKNW